MIFCFADTDQFVPQETEEVSPVPLEEDDDLIQEAPQSQREDTPCLQQEASDPSSHQGTPYQQGHQYYQEDKYGHHQQQEPFSHIKDPEQSSRYHCQVGKRQPGFLVDQVNQAFLHAPTYS